MASLLLILIELFYYVIAPVTVIVLLAKILKALNAGKTKSGVFTGTENVSASASVAEPEMDDSELVAVITAAIHAYETAQGNTAAGNLVVRSIKQRNRW